VIGAFNAQENVPAAWGNSVFASSIASVRRGVPR
jgi:hypothetical protein